VLLLNLLLINIKKNLYSTANVLIKLIVGYFKTGTYTCIKFKTNNN
jgi:hypothetical protein